MRHHEWEEWLGSPSVTDAKCAACGALRMSRTGLAIASFTERPGSRRWRTALSCEEEAVQRVIES